MLSVAAIQMLSESNIQHNLQRAETLIREAAMQGAKFIVLPENFATFSAPDYLQFAQQEQAAQGAVRQQLSQLAKALDIYLLAGTMPIFDQASQKCFATSLLLDDQGQQIAQYQKIHLFDALVNDNQGAYQESAQYQHGDQVVCASTAIANIGMAICYDLRFPELFQQLRNLGANVLVLPSAFTYTTGEKHWQALLQARAIETQCYVIAPNQGGHHASGRSTWGHSMIVSPDGEILAQAALGEHIIYAELDFALLQQLRQRMPIWTHKRL